MRLKLSAVSGARSVCVVSGVGWTPSNELFACSDERVVQRYAMSGEPLGVVAQCDYYVTCMRWLTTVKAGVLSADCLALACSDGAVRLLSSGGRVERVIAAAHTGSALCVAWSADGASLVSGGEDGLVKQWSRNGNLRSKLASAASPVTSICWAPDGERVAFTHGRFLSVQLVALNASAASTPSRQWVAHASLVLCSDWHPISGKLLTGGEDGTYRVWSDDGEALFSSRPLDFAVSAARWAPSGLYFAVGAFNLLALCDAAGWPHSRHRLATGTVSALDWSTDGTHLAVGGSNGGLVLAQLIDRRCDWQQYAVRLTEKNSLAVYDLSIGGAADGVRMEELDFTSPVISMESLAHSDAHRHHRHLMPRVQGAPLRVGRPWWRCSGSSGAVAYSRSAAFALVDPSQVERRCTRTTVR